MDNNNNAEHQNKDEHESTDHIKQSQKSDHHHQAILTAIDAQLDPGRDDFVKRLSQQAEKQEEIERIAIELKGDIKNLANIVKRILNKHHTDYIMTFSAFMETVRRDLRKKIEQMEQIEEQKKKVNDVNVLRCERDFFRSYSIKLSTINKELTTKIEDMSIRIKILTEEVNSLTLKWQSLEKDNKQLAIELESNIIKNKVLKKDIGNMRYMNMNAKIRDTGKDNFNTPLIHQSHPIIHIDDSNINIKSQIASYKHQTKTIEIIEKLKNELKKERNRNYRSSSEINNLAQEKNRLENIFLDCVEETRKNVWNRRLRGTMSSKVASVNSTYFPLNSNGKYETFLPLDKRKILESLLFNDEVWTVLRDALFTNKSIDYSLLSQSKPSSRLHFEKINLRKYPNKKEERTLEDKISFFNPQKSPLSNAKSKRAMYDFLKRAQSHNMLLPIKLNH